MDCLHKALAKLENGDNIRGLAKKVGCYRGTLEHKGGVLDKLTKMGYIKRTRQGRSSIITLTKKGEKAQLSIAEFISFLPK